MTLHHLAHPPKHEQVKHKERTERFHPSHFRLSFFFARKEPHQSLQNSTRPCFFPLTFAFRHLASKEASIPSRRDLPVSTVLRLRSWTRFAPEIGIFASRLALPSFSSEDQSKLKRSPQLTPVSTRCTLQAQPPSRPTGPITTFPASRPPVVSFLRHCICIAHHHRLNPFQLSLRLFISASSSFVCFSLILLPFIRPSFWGFDQFPCTYLGFLDLCGSSPIPRPKILPFLLDFTPSPLLVHSPTLAAICPVQF